MSDAKIAFSINRVVNWTDTSKRVRLDYSLIAHTKINSKCIKDLNVIIETTELLEESRQDAFRPLWRQGND